MVRSAPRWALPVRRLRDLLRGARSASPRRACHLAPRSAVPHAPESGCLGGPLIVIVIIMMIIIIIVVIIISSSSRPGKRRL